MTSARHRPARFSEPRRTFTQDYPAMRMRQCDMNDRHGRKPLTARQRAVYEAVVRHCLSGRQARVRELCRELGYRSTNAVATHVRRLREKGWLTNDRHDRFDSLRPAVPEIEVRQSDGMLIICTTGEVRIGPDDLAKLTGGPSTVAA